MSAISVTLTSTKLKIMDHDEYKKYTMSRNFDKSIAIILNDSKSYIKYENKESNKFNIMNGVISTYRMVLSESEIQSRINDTQTIELIDFIHRYIPVIDIIILVVNSKAIKESPALNHLSMLLAEV